MARNVREKKKMFRDSIYSDYTLQPLLTAQYTTTTHITLLPAKQLFYEQKSCSPGCILLKLRSYLKMSMIQVMMDDLSDWFFFYNWIYLCFFIV